jgi:hypothetical protein
MTDNQSDGHDHSRIRFDKTINLGHVLTMLAMVVAVLVSWSLMDKRVAALEEARITQRDRDQFQDNDRRDRFTEVRDALQDLRRSIEKISDKVGAR